MGKDVQKNNEPATASYNFVRMVNGVLPSPMDAYQKMASAECGGNKGASGWMKKYISQEHARLNGRLQLDITAKTSLFVGWKIEKLPGDKVLKKTFMPADRIVIPGSSLRGMVRSLLKIVTVGSMRDKEDYTDRRMYHRTAPEDLDNIEYGFLVQVGNEENTKYYICHVPKEGVCKQIDKTQKKENSSYIEWQNERTAVYYTVMKGVDNKGVDNKGADNKGGTIKNRYEMHIQKGMWEHRHDVTALISSYRDDKERRGMNLLERENQEKESDRIPLKAVSPELAEFIGCGQIAYIVPCSFKFKENRKEIQSFGYGKSFREPYNHSIHELLPKRITDNEVIDFADAIFGRVPLLHGSKRQTDEESWAGRVFFEDAEPTNEKGTIDTPQDGAILAAPKPTAYALYGKQISNGRAKNWDQQGTTVRGYKLYWHNKYQKAWQKQNSGSSDETELDYKMAPIKQDATFQAVIRFENLTEIELGALCKVFHLAEDAKEDICYKIGMGKSIGLGSIGILPTLYIESKKQYTELFDEKKGEWSSGMEPVEDGGQTFIQAFEAYVNEKLDSREQREYKCSMEDLRNILNWANTSKSGWNQRILMMPSKDNRPNEKFSDEHILETIEDIVEPVRKGKKK